MKPVMSQSLTRPQVNGDLRGTTDTAEPSPAYRRLHHFFEASCDRDPMRIALECGDVHLTYRELDESANRLANHLLDIGVGRGSRVGILLHRSTETYVALLAVLKTDATFVPIDAASPADRVSYIAADSDLALLLSTSGLAALTDGLGCPVVELDICDSGLLLQPATRPVPDDDGDPICYIIYTSGSTGRPKGVEVAQSSICNFIGVVPAIYGVGPADRVYQGMTISFDFSIEEIWPTWAVGAAVVAGPNDSGRLGSELADFLEESAVTMLYCVPTVLATLDRALPGIHTINVGGEACPAELVDRWDRPGRRILNTYGPTETTVTATWAELRGGRPVTIGRPLPTYEIRLLDEDLQPVSRGEVGEICVGGIGVARGYVGRPDLTAARFVVDVSSGEPVRFYRTGDLGRFLPNGEIEYRGRADSEVKVRGHRVDLQEIESVLLEDDYSVATAVVAFLPSAGTGGDLAAYVTRRPSAAVSDDELVARLGERLRRHLPPYMVPGYLEMLAELPMLPSGKVDRGRLPAPVRGRLVNLRGPHVPASTLLERDIVAVWGEVFGLPTEQISVDADFFDDLGGHSLLATTAVSLLRCRGIIPSLAVRDFYAHPTVRVLASHVEQVQARAGDAAAARRLSVPPLRHGSGRVRLSGLAQAGALFFLVLLFSLPIAVVSTANGGKLSATWLVQLAIAFPLTYLIVRWCLPVAGARLLLSGLTPGRYPLWGAVHLRVWAGEKLLALAPVRVLSGSPLLVPYLRLLGARVGARCHIATSDIPLPPLTELGDDVTVGYGVRLQTFLIEDGWLTLEPVVLGDGAVVGSSSLLAPGARVGAGATLGQHSLLGDDQCVPEGERWAGSPASLDELADPVLDTMQEGGSAPPEWGSKLVCGFVAGLVGLELLLPFAAIAPTVALVWWALLTWGVTGGLVAALLSGPVSVVAVCTLILGMRRLAVRATPTGIHHLRSRLGLEKWMGDKLLEASLSATNTLYSTLYTAPWLRALGARVGPRAEVSTAAHFDPDLLTLEAGSFVADMASIGCATYCNGYIAFGRTYVGRRAFVGNAAFVPAGSQLTDGSLIGVHTTPPRGEVPPGSSWLGSPALYLPRREPCGQFAEEMTYRPTRRQVGERLVIEFFRVALPGSLLALAALVVLLGTNALAQRAGLLVVVVATPALGLLTGAAVVVTVAALKWLLVGRYRPRTEPLWSRFVRRTELVTGLFEAAAGPALLNGLTGTPMLGPVLRLFGARVGRRTCLDTTFLTEFDLVTIGDDVAIGTRASLQTHLFEDRVMKMSRVNIGAGCNVGDRSVVLYDTAVESGATLESLSLVMKGEQLPSGTRWRGIPAEAIL